MVNVLQSIILTEGDKMVLTPTYHVYDMYQGHQDATLLGSFVENKRVGVEGAQLDQTLKPSPVIRASQTFVPTISGVSKVFLAWGSAQRIVASTALIVVPYIVASMDSELSMEALQIVQSILPSTVVSASENHRKD